MDYTTAHSCDDFDGECTYCGRIAARRVRIAQQATGRTVPFYVVGYLIHRVYNGPEEGGTWSDVAETVEVRKCYDWRDGRRGARELAGDFCPDRYGRGSVLGGPDGYVGVFREPEDFPSASRDALGRYE